MRNAPRIEPLERPVGRQGIRPDARFYLLGPCNVTQAASVACRFDDSGFAKVQMHIDGVPSGTEHKRMETAYILLSMLLCGLIAAAVGSPKGEGAFGFMLGFLLGPVGIIIVVMMSGNRIPCPFCREKMNRRATVCPHCQRDIRARAMPIPTGHASGYLMNLLILPIVIAAIIGLGASPARCVHHGQDAGPDRLGKRGPCPDQVRQFGAFLNGY